MVKHLNSTKTLNLKESSLHITLVDIDSDNFFINRRQNSYGKLTKIVKPITWVTEAGTIETKRNVKMKFKLDELSTTEEVE